MLSAEDNEDLCQEVTIHEIEIALRSLADNKISRPDGFPASFFKYYWPLVEDRVTCEVMPFFQTGVLSPSWKKTFIVLIPKRVDATKPEHFHPTSLYNMVYKLIAEILVKRLKPLLNDLISKEQGAFVSGRLISDNIMAAQEVAHWLEMTDTTSKFIFAKLDMERAYDKMR